MTPPHPGFSRRWFLAAGTASLAVPLLVSCSDVGSNGEDASDDTTGDDHGGHGAAFGEATGAAVLAPIFDVNSYALSTFEPSRLPVSIRDAEGQPMLDGPDELEIQVREADGTIVNNLVVPRHADGVPLPYYPVRTPFPGTGPYELATDLGEGEVTVPFMVSDPSSSSLRGVGDALPAEPTPTFDDGRGVVPICTRFPDPCPLHDRSLAEVVADGTPTVLMVGTPAYCHIGVCGPVLELLLEEMPTHAGATYVHAEVYTDAEEVGPDRATPAPIVAAVGLSFEPSLFVADATGTIVDRLDFVFDRTEIADALAKVA